MATRTISTRIALEGESEYRASLKKIGAELKLHQSELAKVSAQYRESANSMEALKAKETALKAQLSVLERKYSAHIDMLGKAESAQRLYSYEVEQSQKKLEGARSKLEAFKQSSGDTATQQAHLTAQIKAHEQALATAEQQLQKAENSAVFYQKRINETQRDQADLNGELAQTEGYLDEASKSANQCATSIDQFGAKVKSSTQKVDESAKAVQRYSEAAKSLDSMGNRLTLGLTAPLIAAGAAAVNYSSNTAEAINKTEVAFEDAAFGIKKWSDTTLTAIGLAKGTALDMAALFGDMATSMGFGAVEAADMSKSLVTLSADLASFKNLSIDQVSTALKSIFTGETESLKNLGVVMTEADLKAYALAQGIQTSYESMTQAEKVTLRYQYVMAQTKNAQGDFARTFDGTANQLRVCQESLKELAATAGDELLPILTPMIVQVNGLLQSFGDLDEGTRQLVVETLIFVATLGPMMKIVGGAIKMWPTLNALLTVFRAKVLGATVAQETLNAAIASTPAGLALTVVGGLIAALLSFGATAFLAAEKTETFSDKLRESQKAYEESAAAVRQSNEDTLAMVSALETLAGTEHKSAAQKEALLSLVDRLNETVPNLSLAYDTQTDSLNLTTAAIRDMALAQAEQAEQAAAVERLRALYVDQVSTIDELAAANDALAAAEADKSRMVEEGTYGAMGYESATLSVDAALLEAKRTVNALTEALAEICAELHDLNVAYSDLRKAVDDSTEGHGKHQRAMELSSQATYGAAENTSEMTQALAEMKTATAEQTTQTQALLKETDFLSDAFAEQAKNGGISLDTALKLIDAGYESVVVVDQESGVVRLNAEAYQLLAKDKLAERLAALETQKASINTAIQLRQEAAAAVEAGVAHLELAKVKRQAEGKTADGTISELESQAKSLDAQIAVLQGLLNNLGKVTSGGSGSSGRGSSAASAAKSAADTMVEVYRAAVEELDYLRDMDEIDEATYYRRLEELRDKHLKANSDEWRKATVQLHNFQETQDKAAVQAKEAAYREGVADLKYFRNMDLITEEDYYRRLAALRDQYLQEDSDTWRSANEELYAYKKERLQEELDALKEALEAEKDAIDQWYSGQKDALRDWYDTAKDEARSAYDAEKQAAREAYEARKTQIKETLAAEKARLGEIIAGIDREIQARRELREDEDQDDAIARAQKKLDAAKAQLSFARTDEDKAQWSQEIVRLEQALQDAIEAKEDTAFYREKETEKEEIQDQITAAEDAADKELAAADAAYQATQAKLEEAYQETLKELEAEYAAKLAEMQAEFDRRNAEAEAAYRDAVNRAEDAAQGGGEGGSGGGSTDGFGGNGDPSDYVTDWGGSGGGGKITVDDILNAGAGGYGPDGLGFKPGFNPAASARSAAAALGAAVGAAAGAVMNSVSSVTRNNSASVTIHQAPSLTEGQIAGTVQKVLDRLSR